MRTFQSPPQNVTVIANFFGSRYVSPTAEEALGRAMSLIARKEGNAVHMIGRDMPEMPDVLESDRSLPDLVYDVLKETPGLTTDDIARVVRKTRQAVQKTLLGLTADGIVERKRNGKNTFYRYTVIAEKPESIKPSTTAIAVIYDYICENPGSSSADIADALGGDRKQITDAAARLASCGKISRNRKKSNEPYRYEVKT